MIIFVWSAVIFFHADAPAQGSDGSLRGRPSSGCGSLNTDEGQREINELHVPVGRDVRMIMTSQDVIHSFFVPAFRIKADVLPGRYTMTWFHTTKPGTYHLFCAEYCGTMHSGMIGHVVVMEPATTRRGWRAKRRNDGFAGGNGQQSFQQLAAPPATARYPGTRSEPGGSVRQAVLLDDGRTVTADENYLRESILNPGAKIVSGFKPIMPVFQGQVSEESLTERWLPT
jgi:cytochrome c oxidase subunit II